MAYDEKLAERIREHLSEIPDIEEKKMMGGLTFMVNDKMCVGVFKDEMMCRIDPDNQEQVLAKTGTRIMDFTNRPMKGYILVDSTGIKTKEQFDFWINQCLEFNKISKSSKKKKQG
jgi:TfoX/Sxy family transcriptional regulator of competence genes